MGGRTGRSRMAEKVVICPRDEIRQGEDQGDEVRAVGKFRISYRSAGVLTPRTTRVQESEREVAEEQEARGHSRKCRHYTPRPLTTREADHVLDLALEQSLHVPPMS